MTYSILDNPNEPVVQYAIHDIDIFIVDKEFIDQNRDWYEWIGIHKYSNVTIHYYRPKGLLTP